MADKKIEENYKFCPFFFCNNDCFIKHMHECSQKQSIE